VKSEGNERVIRTENRGVSETKVDQRFDALLDGRREVNVGDDLTNGCISTR
jgi:hypothetical protein